MGTQNHVTLAQLLAAVSDRADLPTLSSTTFITKEQMVRWLNQSGRRLAGKLIAAHGAGYFETSTTHNTVAGQDYTVISTTNAGIFQLIGARVTIDGVRKRLWQAERDGMDWQDADDSTDWTVANPPKWRFTDAPGPDSTDRQRIIWSRTPQSVHAVTVHFVPYLVFWAKGGGSFDGPIIEMSSSEEDYDGIRGQMGWDEWVILDCAAKAKKRQDRPSEEILLLQQERDEIEQDWGGLINRVRQPKRIQRKYRTDKRAPRG